MAKISAGALQCNGRARVFGQTSAGCVNGRDFLQFSDGSGAFISTFQCRDLPDGFRPEHIAIVPD